MYFGSNRHGLLQVSPPNMINEPTYVLPSGPDGSNQSNVEASPYFSLIVDTTDPSLTTATKIVLFDGLGAYQKIFNYVMPSAVIIESGTGGDYQLLLNDFVGNGSYVDILKLTVNDKQKAASQFARSINLYEYARGSEPHLVKTLHPEMGIHEGQFQENINTFKAQMVLTNRTSLVYIQEPGIRVNFGFYQRAEIGRQK
jgi:hypothetical protein